MIEIAFRYDDDILSMTLSGHSGLHPGNDIVCAAASYAFQQLQFWIAQNDPASVRVRNKSGDGYIATDNPAFLPFFRMTELGIRSLAASYPENVCVLVTAGKQEAK